jgi:hypothetical protein
MTTRFDQAWTFLKTALNAIGEIALLDQSELKELEQIVTDELQNLEDESKDF